MIDDGTDEAGDALPATMADMFFALVAIVIFMLLALAPSLGRPAAPARDVWTEDLRIDGRRSAVIVADADGLRLGGEEARRVTLERILDDAALAAFLDEARTGAMPLLVAVEEKGQEASFLLDVAAAANKVATFNQVRIDPGCGGSAEAGRDCTPGTTAGARP